MDFRNKHLLGLYITVIYFVGPACAACKRIEPNQIHTTTTSVKAARDKALQPTIADIYNTFVSIPTTICRSQIRDYEIIAD